MGFMRSRWKALILVVALLGTAGWAVSTMEKSAPDLLVTNVAYSNFHLTLELQNQGPAQFQGPVEVQVVLKQDGKVRAKLNTKVGRGHWPVFGVQRSTPVDISKLLTFDPKVGHVNFLVTATVDPAKRTVDARPQNNTFIKFFGMAGEDANEAPVIRGDYRRSKELPDLVIEELVFDPPYVKARFSNLGGEASGADFRFRWYANGQERGSSLAQRFVVPPPGKVHETGGLSMNLLGLVSGNETTVKAVIDFEDRVRELREDNNTKVQKMALGTLPNGSEPTPQANAKGSVTIGSQAVMPVVCSYVVINPKNGAHTLYLLPFVPSREDITDMRLGQVGQISIRRRARAGGEKMADQRAFLSLTIKGRNKIDGTFRPKRVRVGVNSPLRSHSVDMTMAGALTLGPVSHGKGGIPWSIKGQWPAGKDDVAFDCRGRATVYQGATP
jgi:hypothetical protein